MNLGNDIARTRCSGFKHSKSILILFATVFVAFFVSASTQAQTITTDTTDYAPGTTVEITGSGFWSGETITLQVTHDNGYPLDGLGHEPWEIVADGSGDFVAYWGVPYDDNEGEVLRLTADGQSSNLSATTTFTDAIGVNLDQLHNGTASATPKWANGNINTNNSCYAENDGVPFRFFVTGTAGGSTHFFTIQMEWTKGGIHAYDYLVDYDLTDAAAIASSDGPCGNISTSAPSDCNPVLSSFPFPDPTDVSNYTGAIGSDTFPTIFTLSSPANLKFYNATIDSLGPYWFTGSASDRELNMLVTFTTIDTSSAGFYWGGHMAHGVPGAWGADSGSASVGGAPYHMRTKNFDNSGGKNQDRSIQGGVLCLSPQATFSCADSVLSCVTTSSSCTADDLTADSYDWQITGAIIDSGQGTSTVYYTATSSDWIYITLEACDSTSGCPGDFCCNNFTDSVQVTVDNTPPIIVCPDDATVECDAVPSVGTATATDDCDPNPVVTYLGEVNTAGACANSYTLTRSWEAIDANGNADTCEQTITVEDNTAPTVTAPANATFDCVMGNADTATYSDNCGSASISFTDDTTNAVCPLTITRTWIATDACGNSDSDTQIIIVQDTTAPVITCPANLTFDCDNVGSYGVATATDDCDGAITPTFTDSIVAGACASESTTYRTWTAIDACGNISSCVQIITIQDTTAPAITAPADIAFDCVIGNADTAAYSDNCGIDSVSFVDDTTSTSCPITINRTWTAYDLCGNSASDIQIITIQDTTAPSVTAPADVVFDCVMGNADTATYSDNCGASISFTDDTTSARCPLSITRTWTATDMCGNTASDIQLIVVQDTTAPSITAPADVTFDCVMGNADTATYSDNCAIASVGFTDDTTSFRCPLSITRTWTATDTCGNSASDTQLITVQDTTAPVCSVPNDTTIFLCSTGTVCFPVSAVDNCDPSPVCSQIAGDGSYSNGNWCYDASAGSTIVQAIFECIDSCNNSCYDTINVTIVVNTRPVVNIAARTMDACPGDTVCVSYTVTDAENNVTIEELTANPLGASLNTSSNQFCFTAPDTGCYDFIIQVTDSCGLIDSDTITVCVTELPVASSPNNYTEFVCDLSQICVPGFSCENATSSYAIGGTLSGNTICFTPVEGSNSISIVCVNDCGVDTSSVTITIVLNSAPTSSCPPNRIDTVCVLPEQICIVGFGASDPDGNLASCTLNGQPFDPSGSYCFAPVEGPNYFVFECTDSCGATSSCSFTVDIVVDPSRCIGDCAVISIEKTHETPQGQYEEVAVTIDVLPFEIGGLDLLIEYDASALSLSDVTTGSFIINCGWEYYTYRNGAAGNCGSNACPSGKVRIISVAETNNGANHPACFQAAPAEIARLVFLVTNDRTFECQYVPIRFCWYDCGDNSLSSKTGEDIYISDSVFNYYDGVIWNDVTDISAEFPSLFGANYTCDVDLSDGKPDPIRALCFYNGGIDIVCADSIDDRGDINLNGVSNEVADAVLLGNYFIYGLSVFTINLEGQIAASDVNADGTVLSVADLVYLIRIVLGDALPYSKVVASVNIDFYHYSDGRLAVGEKTAIGAAYVVAEGDVTPILLASEMDMKYHFDGTNTRVLVWSESGSGFTGDFLLLDADLISFELATAEGQPVSLNTLPTAYELLQNYPNPFNPSTVISFTLPNASEYSLTIYNLNGQVVKEFEGVANSAGTIELEWLAVDVASGVYFYKLKANYGKYVETKKMILLK